MLLNRFYVDDIIKRAICEDINYLDLAADLLTEEGSVTAAEFISKDEGVLCGIDVCLRVFELLDEGISIKKYKNDGDRISKGDCIAEISGSTASILKGERTSLNLLQHMSGIATITSKYAEQCKGTNATVAETRKTLPGLRALEKYSVMIGGGRNHRFNLSDAAMIKDNHIDACGGITAAVMKLRSRMGHMNKIEVEVRDINEFREAVESGADVVMLDNMSAAQMTECVNESEGRVLIEASGNITLDNIRETALTGVDIISVGALTHSVKAFDISLKIRK